MNNYNLGDPLRVVNNFENILFHFDIQQTGFNLSNVQPSTLYNYITPFLYYRTNDNTQLTYINLIDPNFINLLNDKMQKSQNIEIKKTIEYLFNVIKSIKIGFYNYDIDNSKNFLDLLNNKLETLNSYQINSWDYFDENKILTVCQNIVSLISESLQTFFVTENQDIIPYYLLGSLYSLSKIYENTAGLHTVLIGNPPSLELEKYFFDGFETIENSNTMTRLNNIAVFLTTYEIIRLPEQQRQRRATTEQRRQAESSYPSFNPEYARDDIGRKTSTDQRRQEAEEEQQRRREEEQQRRRDEEQQRRRDEQQSKCPSSQINTDKYQNFTVNEENCNKFKREYRKDIRKIHPDHNQGCEKEATEKSKILNDIKNKCQNIPGTGGKTKNKKHSNKSKNKSKNKKYTNKTKK